MIKAVLFDVDGVVFEPRDKYFSQRLREDGKEVPEEEVRKFFDNEYKEIVIGKANLKKELEKYLQIWSWQGTVEELLNYWFSYENKINQKVIGLVKELRSEGVKSYLASDHSRYRTDDFMNKVGLSQYFDGVFSSGYLGVTKEETTFFISVLEELDLSKNEVLFIDDDPKNVKVAEEFGIGSFRFGNNESSIRALKDWIGSKNN